MKVKEVMQRKVISVKPQDDCIDALKLLFKMKISGLPVIDEQGKLAGMFTEKEVLSRLLPSYIDKVGVFIYEEDSKVTKNKFVKLSSLTVAEVMRKEVAAVKEEATLTEVAKDMLTRKARRIIILDDSGKVSGIVARVDILEALAKQAGLFLNTL